MQEELEQRTVSVSIQAAKLSGRVLRAAIAAVLQKMEQERTMPRVGPLKFQGESALLNGMPENIRYATI